MTEIRDNLSFSRVFINRFLFTGAAFLIALAVIVPVTAAQFVVVAVLLLFTGFILLIFIGKRVKEGLIQLNELIKSITKNKIKVPEEIKLGRNLVELEGNIKAMFLKMQNDISNQKKLEQVRTEFLGNVSHELRTPIFAIQGYLETLLDGAIEDVNVSKTFLTKANRHTQNLNNLLNDLINISMIESGQMKMSFRYFNIKDFLETLYNEFKPLAEDKHLQLILHPVKPGLRLFGDKDRLRQVMTNLISNAIKYTEQGKVEISCEINKDYGKISIKDTGLGLSSEDVNRIFERFYRVDKDRSRAVGGTGLGLAIVKHIVEAHDSKVYVNSRLGAGSEFSFHLKK